MLTRVRASEGRGTARFEEGAVHAHKRERGFPYGACCMFFVLPCKLLQNMMMVRTIRAKGSCVPRAARETRWAEHFASKMKPMIAGAKHVAIPIGANQLFI